MNSLLLSIELRHLPWRKFESGIDRLVKILGIAKIRNAESSEICLYRLVGAVREPPRQVHPHN